MIRICPSILNADFAKLPSEISKVKEFADFIHLDIMDNQFVPNKTFDFDEAREIVRESTLPIDVHLMVENCDHWGVEYANLRELGVFSVTVHFEATARIRETLSAIKDMGVRTGVALKPVTEFDLLIPYIDLIDMVLVMTVEPGFGGQKFMSQMLPKVERARDWLAANGYESTWLQVDGGISLETICDARKSGADTFVAGSAVYKSPEPGSMVRDLRRRAEECS